MNGNGKLPKLPVTGRMASSAAIIPDFRARDREREIFFREIGTLADRYGWKHKTKKNPHKVEPVRTASSLQRAKEVIMPFPPAWMDSVFKVLDISLHLTYSFHCL